MAVGLPGEPHSAPYWSILVSTSPYCPSNRPILVYTGLYWSIPVHVTHILTPYRSVLPHNDPTVAHTAPYWSLLVHAGPYCPIPVPTSPYWSMLVCTAPYRSLPVHTGPYRSLPSRRPCRTRTPGWTRAVGPLPASACGGRRPPTPPRGRGAPSGAAWVAAAGAAGAAGAARRIGTPPQERCRDGDPPRL